MLPRVPDDTRSVAVGDVDGDGDLDAMFGNGSASVPSQNRLHLNDGSGVFADATGQLPGIADATTVLALGDLDGDGDLDAFVGNEGQNRLHLNDGVGVFTDVTSQLPVFPDSTRAVAVGDVDGDGDLDLVAGNAGQNRLLLNDGSGVFTDATSQLPALAADTRAVALGDVDGDGDLDLVTGGVGSCGPPPVGCSPGPLRLSLNDGSGGFTLASSNFPTSASHYTVAIALGDVDGDGDLDLYVGARSLGGFQNGQNALYLNNGGGSFANATGQLPMIDDATHAVALEDVDGDSDLDALVGNAGLNRLHLNDGSGLFTDATGQLPAVPDTTTTSLALADVDGDADVDLLFGTGGQNRLLLNDGLGTFTDVTAPLAPFPPSLFPFPPGPEGVALGDVDGDGDLDSLRGSSAYHGFGSLVQNRLYVNDGIGGFTDATAQLPTILDGTVAVALGDVDGDGDLDALLGNLGFFNNGLQNRLYVNDGAGVFSDATAQLPAISDSTRSVALGDVDGDGDLDALIGNGGSNPSPGQQNRLLLNGGAGVFTDAAAQIPSISDSTRELALGDVDGDGDLDLLLGNDGQNRLHLNDGAGVFTDATAQLPSISDPTFGIALGDVDGDGDLDLLVGNDGQNRLHLNDGAGVFTDATAQLPSIPDPTLGVALGDVDGDGDLDALVSNRSSGQQTRLLLNTGGGAFTDATAQFPSISSTGAIALGDVDGDGDLDAWLGKAGEDALLSNLSRHLAWRGVPRVGKPLTMDLYGPSSGAWFLAVSLGTASLPFPPFGTLRLDPVSLVFVGAGPLDAQGNASLTFAVPAIPAFVGTTVYWQGVVGGPLFFTNLEPTTATAL